MQCAYEKTAEQLRREIMLLKRNKASIERSLKIKRDALRQLIGVDSNNSTDFKVIQTNPR